MILSPLMLAVMIAGVVGNVAQFGFLFTTDSLTPNLGKLNPVSGVKRLFSLKSLVELVKSVLKLLVVGLIAYLVLKGELDNIPGLMFLGVRDILDFIGDVSFDIILYVSLVLIILAVLDFSYQRWQHEKDMRMTKQEVKDEGKEREGDPQIKARIRSAQMELSRRRMMEKVPEADVVITNPTHYAVALQFNPKEMVAPRVVAKGSNLVAQKIKKIARENHVPVLEDKPLAQALYKAVDIDDFIPAELYRAVAEVLAYVYRLNGKGPAGKK
ncbi:MAG: flagellar biosynthesis protein FlhB, partial [Desulfobacterales bacterium]|nr:flagellar biosynthesis protein FlhB [Desulfobacterales bacterium]